MPAAPDTHLPRRDRRRLVSSTVVREPEWLDDDYETAVMWQEEQNLSCPGCGSPRDEAWIWSPEEQDEKQASVKGHIRTCVVCAERDFTHEQYRAAEGVPYGRYPVVEKVSPPQR